MDNRAAVETATTLRVFKPRDFTQIHHSNANSQQINRSKGNNSCKITTLFQSEKTQHSTKHKTKTMEKTGTGTGKSRVAFGLFFFLLLSICIDLVLSASVDVAETVERETGLESQSGEEEKITVHLCIKVTDLVEIFRTFNRMSGTGRFFLKNILLLAFEQEVYAGERWYRTGIEEWVPAASVEVVKLELCPPLGLD